MGANSDVVKKLNQIIGNRFDEHKFHKEKERTGVKVAVLTIGSHSSKSMNLLRLDCLVEVLEEAHIKCEVVSSKHHHKRTTALGIELDQNALLSLDSKKVTTIQKKLSDRIKEVEHVQPSQTPPKAYKPYQPRQESDGQHKSRTVAFNSDVEYKELPNYRAKDLVRVIETIEKSIKLAKNKDKISVGSEVEKILGTKKIIKNVAGGLNPEPLLSSRDKRKLAKGKFSSS